jgi:RNA polymerase sigma-70 factor (ECF subfamily)
MAARQAAPKEERFESAPAARSDLVELLGAVKLRDEAALSKLYDATASRVQGLARTILSNAADAEEVVGDTYLQAWNSAAHFDPARGSVVAWLLMMCRSRALDLLRQRRSRALVEGAAPGFAEEAEAAAPEDLLRQVQVGQAVHRALGGLTPLRRQLLALAFFRGMSHQEIAAAARLPVGTVKSHLRRSLQGLRLVLGEAAV